VIKEKQLERNAKMQTQKQNIIKLCDLKPAKDVKGSSRNLRMRIASNRRIMSGDYGRRLH
jgi:hypothetical protein